MFGISCGPGLDLLYHTLQRGRNADKYTNQRRHRRCRRNTLW